MAKGSMLQHAKGTVDEFAMTDVGLNGDGSFQRGKDPKMDGGSGGDGLTSSPFDMGGSGLPSAGDPIMAVSQSLDETPNRMSGMPKGIEGENLGPGDPGPGGHVEFEDLGGSVAGNTVPTKELTNFGKA